MPMPMPIPRCRCRDFQMAFDMEHYTERRCSSKLFGASVTQLTSDLRGITRALWKDRK